MAKESPVWRLIQRLQGEVIGEKVKGNRRQSTRRKGEITIIIIGGDKEQEVAVRHMNLTQRKEISIWGWHDEFAIAGARSSKQKERNPRKGE